MKVGDAARGNGYQRELCITLLSQTSSSYTLSITSSFVFFQPQSIDFNSLPPLMHTILTRTETFIQTAHRMLSLPECKCFYCQCSYGLTMKENWTWKDAQSSLWKERKTGVEAERKRAICLDGPQEVEQAWWNIPAAKNKALQTENSFASVYKLYSCQCSVSHWNANWHLGPLIKMEHLVSRPTTNLEPLLSAARYQPNAIIPKQATTLSKLQYFPAILKCRERVGIGRL